LELEDNGSANDLFDPELKHLKWFLTSSSSFELLSPDRMRSRGSRGRVTDIGMGGERLAAYIHSMSSTKKAELSKQVSEFIGSSVKITTTTKGQPGWVEMYLEEIWSDNDTRIKKSYISDGLLRIIALMAIIVGNEQKQRFFKPKPIGMILLDEIEDGINPNLSEKVIGLFRKLTEDTGKQIVITSHSPVMLNYVDENDIQFMWRGQTGMIHLKPLFRTPRMKETLDFLNPGEVWLNYSKEDIIGKLSSNDIGGWHD
jgi:predicted ATPase